MKGGDKVFELVKIGVWLGCITLFSMIDAQEALVNFWHKIKNGKAKGEDIFDFTMLCIAIVLIVVGSVGGMADWLIGRL